MLAGGQKPQSLPISQQRAPLSTEGLRRLKQVAHWTVSNAIRSGRLIPQPCEVCGSTKNIHAHHDDYTKPLIVRWLCLHHHHDEHSDIWIPTDIFTFIKSKSRRREARRQVLGTCKRCNKPLHPNSRNWCEHHLKLRRAQSQRYLQRKRGSIPGTVQKLG